MKFAGIGQITEVEGITKGPGVQALAYLRKAYGSGRWWKLKGKATVRLPNGMLRKVELHWYEAHGLWKRNLKIKQYLDEP